jgi:integrase
MTVALATPTRQRARVRAAKDDEDWGALFVVGLKTGLRISELLALRGVDVELTGTPRLHVTRGVVDGIESAPKRGKARAIALNDLEVAVLTTRRRAQPKAKLVFGTSADTWRSRHQAMKALRRLCDAAGVERAGVHTTRHNEGRSLIQIRDLLGHASIQQTEV